MRSTMDRETPNRSASAARPVPAAASSRRRRTFAAVSFADGLEAPGIDPPRARPLCTLSAALSERVPRNR